jgi:hypothetical protein
MQGKNALHVFSGFGASSVAAPPVIAPSAFRPGNSRVLAYLVKCRRVEHGQLAHVDHVAVNAVLLHLTPPIQKTLNRNFTFSTLPEITNNAKLV